MPIQTISVPSLGQYGQLPDVAPSNLPLNAATYARNFRFHEGDFAEVTAGYTNALNSRNVTELGESNTDITFLYTWILSQSNALGYYDGGNNRMMFVENNSASDLVEYNLSVTNSFVGTFTFVTGTTPAEGEFAIDRSSNSVIIHVASGDLSTLQAAAVQNATIEAYQNNDRFAIKTIGASATVNTSGNVVTIAGLAEVPVINRRTEGIILRISTPFEHNTDSTYTWQGTDAQGVPIFNNPFEAPWVFVDGTIPHIQELNNWPSSMARAQHVTKFNAFIMALAYENSAGAAGARGNARTIAISDVITTPGTLPMWDFDNDDSFAQLFDLSLYTDGEIVSGFEQNNVFYINTTTDVIAMTYQGNGEFAATRLPIGSGVLTSKSSVAIPNGFFNIGNGRIYTHDGSSFTEIGEGKWSDSWFDALDDSRLDEMQLTYDSRSSSVFIKTPISDSSQEVWVYNLDNDTISVLDDHQEVRFQVWSADGIPAQDIVWDSINPEQTWDTLTQNTWNEFPILLFGDFRNRVLGCGGRFIFVHDFGTTYNGREIQAVYRRENMRLLRSAHFTLSIERVVPWVEGNIGDTVSVRVGSSQTAAHSTVWTPLQTYTLGTSERLHFRRLGNWAAVEFRCNTSGVTISGYDFDINTVQKGR